MTTVGLRRHLPRRRTGVSWSAPSAASVGCWSSPCPFRSSSTTSPNSTRTRCVGRKRSSVRTPSTEPSATAASSRSATARQPTSHRERRVTVRRSNPLHQRVDPVSLSGDIRSALEDGNSLGTRTRRAREGPVTSQWHMDAAACCQSQEPRMVMMMTTMRGRRRRRRRRKRAASRRREKEKPNYVFRRDNVLSDRTLTFPIRYRRRF